jgi:TatD DNase family protein
MENFIDFHTHNLSHSNPLRVYNHIVQLENHLKVYGYFTAGVHPWYLDDIGKQCLELEKIIVDKNCIAVGECGLDRACKTNHANQYLAFVQQCKIALYFDKPMVIHCVKAHFDTIKILKEQGIHEAVFHGYNTRYTILEKILAEGYMVSFGSAILHKHSSAASLIKSVPLDHFFLETDDSKIDIKEIYKAACELLGIEIEKLKDQLHKNFNTFIA